ncbi:MAG: hypothetical protein L0Y72_31465 [Gemmataceae bacterium]|nr:hypothetical protein [Gemmataceae bacterium]MCI0743571.1 hypothetical protein [Gemmataceae bacterium]
MKTLWLALLGANSALRRRRVLILALLAGLLTAFVCWLSMNPLPRERIALPAGSYDKAVSPDGRYLAVAVGRWDQKKLEGQRQDEKTLEWKKWNFTYEYWREDITFWDLSNRQPLGSFIHDQLPRMVEAWPWREEYSSKRHFPFSERRHDFAFVRDGRQFAVRVSSFAFFYDVRTGARLPELECPASEVDFGLSPHWASFVWGPTGLHLVVRDRQKGWFLIEDLSPELSRFIHLLGDFSLPGSSPGVLCRLAVSLFERREIPTGNVRHKMALDRPEWRIGTETALSHDGDTLVLAECVAVKNIIRVWQLRNCESRDLEIDAKNPVVSPQGRFLAFHSKRDVHYHPILERVGGWLGLDLSDKKVDSLFLYDLHAWHDVISWDGAACAYFSTDGNTMLVRTADAMLVYDLPLGPPWRLIVLNGFLAAVFVLLVRIYYRSRPRASSPLAPVGEGSGVSGPRDHAPESTK